MSRALLLYNPRSGSGMGERLAPRLVEILRERYAEIEAEATRGAGTAGEQVRDAVARGVGTVFVCGGDGTLFEALQGAVGADVTLGVLPLGTGNVVARDLSLPLDAVAAASALLGYEKRLLPVGVASRDEQDDVFFLTAAGAGLHAELMHLPKTGGGASRAHYFREGLRLVMRGGEQSFRVRLTMCDAAVRDEDVSELIVARVGSFGGVLKLWKPGADLTSEHMRVVFTRSHHRLKLVWWLLKSVAGVKTQSDAHVVSVDVASVECVGDPHAQVDGEAFGFLPVRFGVRREAIRMLMPHRYGR